MKKLLLIAAGCAALLTLFTGCSTNRLATGKYQISTPGREDWAAVYDDNIYIHIKTPESAAGALEYWDWSGEYKLEDNGVIDLKMDNDTKRRWNFYYQFVKQGDSIILNDWSVNSASVLNYCHPRLRPGVASPRPMSSSGVNPQYQDFSGNR